MVGAAAMLSSDVSVVRGLPRTHSESPLRESWSLVWNGAWWDTSPACL